MSWIGRGRIWLATLSVVLGGVESSAVSGFQDLIRIASENSETVQSSNKTIEAIQAEIAGRDLLLSTKLDAELADARDDRDTLTADQKYHSRLLNASLTKLFATGTQMSLTLGNSLADTNATGTRNTGSWEFKLSQSLWRDAFGLSTSLRHEAEKNELQSRTLTALFQRQSFFVDLEGVYWDLVQALRELEIRKQNIQRSEIVEKWTRERLQRSTAENTDWVQAQALVSSRQLDLVGVQTRIASFQNRLQQMIPNQSPSEWKLNLQELEQDRPPQSLLAIQTGSREPVRLDSLSSEFRSHQAEAEARNVDQNLRPKLDAYVMYGQNGVDERFATSWSRAGNPDLSESRIGLLFSMDLDGSLKESQRRAARLNAQARELEARAQSRFSGLGWSDLQRQIQDLKRQSEEAARLAELQEKKVVEERNRYRLGRTTVFQLISFEIDAANSKIQHSQILTNLRKAESLARVFTRQQDGLL